MNTFSNFLSFIIAILKIGGIAFVGIIAYALIFGTKGDRIIHPISAVISLGATVFLCVNYWNNTRDIIQILVHAILPGVIAYIIGCVLYQMDEGLLFQTIGTAVGFGAVYLITLWTASYLYTIAGIVLLIAFFPVLSFFCSGADEYIEKKRSRIDELKYKSSVSPLDATEIRELKILTHGNGNYDDARVVEGAIDEYNKYHQNDPPISKDDPYN